MWLAKNIHLPILKGLTDNTRFAVAAVSAAMIVGSITIFSAATLYFIFDYFSDVVFEIIFFFVVLSVGVNVAVHAVIASTVLFYGK